MLALNDGRAELWQWDTGRTLSVDADCSQVHFSNKVFGRSIDVDVIDGVAIIPDILLQTDKELNVWAFAGTAENGYTKISKTFKVNRRNKPADYVFTPTDQTTIDEIAAIAQSVRNDADAGLFNGKRGADGGWYTPSVTQPGENTLRMAFTPSKDDMPAVADTDITLPSSGGGGESSIALDTTLTQSGQAADAAAVGNRLSALSEEIVTTAESKVSAHNAGDTSHSDIRMLISGLTNRLNALADSDDTTLDQLSEVVAYIKSNRELISAITTDKVSVADIVNNLTTNVANKPLSSAQGVALKALIDAITVPDKLPNPNALTFTGAVTGTYDGSAPVSVEIPSGGGGRTLELIADVTTAGETTMISITQDSDGNPFSIKSWAAYIYIPAHERDTAKSFYARGASYGGGMNFNNMLITNNKAIGFFLYPIANYDAQDALGASGITNPLKVQYISTGTHTGDAVTGFGISMSVFQVYTNNTKVLFPAGVRVRLWGVRR